MTFSTPNLCSLWFALSTRAATVSGTRLDRPKYAPGTPASKHIRPALEWRDTTQFLQSQAVDGKGKGAPFGGGPGFPNAILADSNDL